MTDRAQTRAELAALLEAAAAFLRCPNPPDLTKHDVAALFGVSARTVLSWAKVGALGGYQLEKSDEWRFEQADVDAYRLGLREKTRKRVTDANDANEANQVEEVPWDNPPSDRSDPHPLDGPDSREAVGQRKDPAANDVQRSIRDSHRSDRRRKSAKASGATKPVPVAEVWDLRAAVDEKKAARAKQR